MNETLVRFGLALMIAGSLLSITISLAKAQVETCPTGYYLATNNLCYPYQQQAPTGQVQTTSNTSSLATRLGSSLGHLISPVFTQLFAHAMGTEVTYGTNGNITHVCLKPGALCLTIFYPRFLQM